MTRYKICGVDVTDTEGNDRIVDAHVEFNEDGIDLSYLCLIDTATNDTVEVLDNELQAIMEFIVENKDRLEELAEKAGNHEEP